MPFYIVRVELHEATSADYFTLHHHMASNGFERVISNDAGDVYELPNGEYGTGLNLSVSEIRSLAARTAAMTGKSCRVFVSEMIRWAAHGLKQVESAPR